MTPEEFIHNIRHVCEGLGGSVTSWGRTVARNATVGGVDGSAHTWWLGADVVWDKPVDQKALGIQCEKLGLWPLHEKDHTHFQPVGWKNRKH